MAVGVKPSEHHLTTGARGTRSAEQKQVISAWRAYCANERAEADRFILAVDPLLRSAVQRLGRGVMRRSSEEDALQELRIKLFVERFLLSSRRLRRLTSSVDPSDRADAALFACLRNTIFMVARWKVSDVLRDEARLFCLLAKAALPDGDEPIDTSASDPSEADLERQVAAAGCDPLEARLVTKYLTGSMSQAQLARALGLQQPAVSKRLRRIRAAVEMHFR